MNSPSSPKILVVDDSEIVLEIARFTLEQAGFTVVTRDTPFGGFAAMIHEQPDLVLLDLSMPGIDGEMLLEVIGAQREQIEGHIVFHSDRDAAELEELVSRVGVSGYIKKTNDSELLIKQIRGFLAQKP